MVPPLAVDIDGTLTDGDGALDPRVFGPLRAWDAPVVLATGKAFPYPIALCSFLGIPLNVIAENGGVVSLQAMESVVLEGEGAAAREVAAAFEAAGYDLGWGPVDLVNRWRETEIAVARDRPREPLERLAADRGLTVVDTGYAYHVTSPDVSKATGLETAAAALEFPPEAFVAIGDSENDAAVFDLVGTAYAVANADGTARDAADVVTDASYADGFLAAIEAVRSGA